MVSISTMRGVLIHSTKLKSSTKFMRGAKGAISTAAELISVSTLSLELSHMHFALARMTGAGAD